jgi:hypothetical protein
MYLRDPAGNLVEIDWPDASTIDRGVITEIVRLADVVPQGAEGRAARLYTGPRTSGTLRQGYGDFHSGDRY